MDGLQLEDGEVRVIIGVGQEVLPVDPVLELSHEPPPDLRILAYRVAATSEASR